MRVFILPEEFSGERTFTLTGRDYHYLVRVLRLKEGAVLTGRAKDGSLWNLLINTINLRESRCKVTCSRLESEPREAFDLPEIHVYQCLLKGKKFDRLLRQLVEIGVTRFIPVASEFTIPDVMSKGAQGSRRDRWQQIRDEALQQSGSPVITDIEAPLKFSHIAEDWSSRGLGLMFHQEPLDPKSLREVITEYQEDVSRIHFPVALVIGPEGGLSDRELGTLKQACFKPAYLPTNILRSETAAIYAAACTQMLLSERS
ncbi:MAG: RsmE family RNA methyltransferase [Spirochaetota bacterium]